MKRPKWFLNYEKVSKKQAVIIIGQKIVDEMEMYTINNGWDDYSLRMVHGIAVMCRF